MEPIPSDQKFDKRNYLILAGVLVLFFAPIIMFVTGTWPNSKLSACDDMIRATLRAPSTYERISAEGGYGMYTISFDAANSFGVPIRGKGICNVDAQPPTWFQYPSSVSQ